MTYTAYVMYKQDRELTTITRSDYTSKKAFAEDLRRNGYAVKLISTPEKFNHDLEVYCEKKERRNEIDRFVRAELKKSRERIKAATEELTKANNEEATQEDETMRFKKDYFAVTTKKVDKFNAIRFDSDIEFDVTNCTEDQEPDAIRKALEKFVDELKKHGGAEILVDSLEMSLRFDEIGPECTFNEIRNGGNAFEIEINRYDDKSMSIYLRICEHQDAPTEEPATEEQKNYYAESYSFGFVSHNSEYGAPSLLIFSSKEDREKYINKYDIYRGNVNKRVIAITAKEARKYYERTRDGVRGWKDGTEYIKHIRDNIYYSVESGDYGRTSEEFTL